MYIGVGVGVTRAAGDDRPLSTLFAAAIDRGKRAEQDGYDFVTAYEHHSDLTQPNPSPLLLLAGLATNTTSIGLGTTVLVGPLYDPVRLIEDVTTVDLLAAGRLSMLALGSGSSTEEFTMYGLVPSTRFERLLEISEVLRRATENRSPEFAGTHLDVPDLPMLLSSEHVVPVFVAAMGPRMMRRVGSAGFHLMNTLETNWHFPEYVAGLRDAGRRIDDMNVAMSGLGAVVLDSSKLAANIRDRVQRLARASTESYLRERDLTAAAVSPLSEWRERGEQGGRIRGGLVGTPDEILAELEPILKDSPVTHLKGGSTTLGGARSEKLWLREVVPVLRTWGRPPRPQRTLAADQPDECEGRE